MKRYEQLRQSMLRLGQRAEEAYLSNQNFSLTLEFPTLGAALAFRLDFYATRKFLNHQFDRNKPEVLPFATIRSGLNRLSCARCDREPALKHLADYGYVPLYFKLAAIQDTDIDHQLDALGFDPIDPTLNVNTMRNSDFNALSSPASSSSTSPQQLYAPSAPPSQPISLPTAPSSLPESFPILSYQCTITDFNARSSHENAIKLQRAIEAHSSSPSLTTRTQIKLFRRKLLDSATISATLQDFLLNNTELDSLINDE